MILLLAACAGSDRPLEGAWLYVPPEGDTGAPLEDSAPADTADTAPRDSADTAPADTGPTCLDPLDPAAALEHLIDGEADACEVAWYLASLDEREQNAGPWYEDMWVTWSQDGRYFDLGLSQRIKVGAAVPDAIRGPDGRVYLFYGEGDLEVGREAARAGSIWFRTHGLIGYGALSLLVSDDGRTFEPVEEFEVTDIVRGMVVDPDVRQLPDGRYRMYYVGSTVPELLAPGAWDDGAPHTVYYAESDDLVHWTQIGEAVDGPNADPSVYCPTEDECLLASTGLDWSVSTDGGQTFAFTPSGIPPAFAPEFLDYGDGVARMYFNSMYPGGALQSWLTTDGGATWVDEGERVEARLVEAVSIIADDDVGWLVYYHYWQDGIHGDTWNEGQYGDTADTGGDTSSP